MWGDEQRPVVQRLNRLFKPTQSLHQLQLHGEHQVSPHPGHSRQQSSEKRCGLNCCDSKEEKEEVSHLVKRGCFRCSKTTMKSPGSFPGSWSPSPWKTIFCPSFMPAREVSGQYPESESNRLSPFSTHLCWCRPSGPSSSWELVGRRSLCSGPSGWSSCPFPYNSDTCWTPAALYPVWSAACKPARRCRGTSRTFALLPSDSRGLPGQMKLLRGSKTASFVAVHEGGQPMICSTVLWWSGHSCRWNACKPAGITDRWVTLTFASLTDSVLLHAEFSAGTIVKIF